MTELQTDLSGIQVSISVFATKILRHRSKQFGLTLDDEDRCDLAEFLKVFNKYFRYETTESEILYVLENSHWRGHHRFEVKDGKVRATYRHTYYDSQDTD